MHFQNLGLIEGMEVLYEKTYKLRKNIGRNYAWGDGV